MAGLLLEALRVLGPAMIRALLEAALSGDDVRASRAARAAAAKARLRALARAAGR